MNLREIFEPVRPIVCAVCGIPNPQYTVGKARMCEDCYQHVEDELEKEKL